MSERDVTPGQFPKGLSARAVVIIIAVVAVVAIGFSSFFVVDQKEQGVVLRFGKFQKLVEPGLNFKLPFGVDRAYNVPTQAVLKEEFGFRSLRPGVTTVYSSQDFPEESIMLTGDLNIVDVEWIIQYRITDPVKWLFMVENQEKTIRDISQSAVNLLVGDRAILDVIGPERANIERLAQDRMNELFNKYNLGIQITTVKLQNIVPPAGPVQSAFEDVNKAIQDRSRLINEGKEAYNQAIPRAKGEAQQVVQQAQGYALERVNKSQGDVARFADVLKEYNRNPQVTRNRLYLEMFEDVFKNADGTDLVDRNLKNFIPFKSLENTPAPAKQVGGGQ